MGAPECHVPKIGKIRVLPLVEAGWVRAHQDADLPQARIVTRSKRLNPPLDDVCFVDRTSKQRGADPQHVQLVWIQSDAFTERTARQGRLAAEPVVVALRASDGHEVRRHTMQLDRFLLLRLVPNEYAVWHLPQERLARQVVPAADAQHAATARRLRAREMVGLR